VVILLATDLYRAVYDLTCVLQRHKASQITESHYDPVRTQQIVFVVQAATS